MKKILITMALVATTAASFAQGKILFGNDASHLVEMNGAAVNQTNGWTDLSMTLWAGPSAGSMTLQTTILGDTIGNPAFPDGRINNRNWLVVGAAAGTTFFQIQLFSTAAGSYNAAQAQGLKYGSSPVFSAVSGSFAYNSMVSPAAPSLSTWAAGPLTVIVPEPTSMVLAGLGAASLLLFRRRQ